MTSKAPMEGMVFHLKELWELMAHYSVESCGQSMDTNVAHTSMGMVWA